MLLILYEKDMIVRFIPTTKALFYMFAGMNDVLRKKHEDMEIAYEIWESLQAMFGQQSDQCRHEATRSYMNSKMKKLGVKG